MHINNKSVLRIALAVSMLFGFTAALEAKIKRSAKARSEFKRINPCPSTGKQTGACPGWIIDHIAPLACGGADTPSNMQWQTVEEAKAKDKWERDGCNKNSGGLR